MRNPQKANQIQSLMKNNGNPQELLNQTIKGYTPEQIQQFRQYAKGFGITDEQLEKFGIGSK